MSYITFTSRNRKVAIECSDTLEENSVLAILDKQFVRSCVVAKRPARAHIRVNAIWWLSKV